MAGSTLVEGANGETYRPAEVEVKMALHVRRAVESLGRTEDIRFSPDNSLAALAGFSKGCCLFLDLRFDAVMGRPVVLIDDCFELRSPAISQPHGFDFIGNDRIVIGNRNSAIAVFKLHQRPYQGKTFTAEPERTIRRTGFFHKLGTPGSICVVSQTGSNPEILVCNTYRNKVSSHRFSSSPFADLANSRVLLKAGLNIPDGIAVSPCGRFIAISNHNLHCVSVYDRNTKLGPASRPSGTLTGVAYPHGLRFSPDGRFLYVADAGQPLVHQFESQSGIWTGEMAPVSSARVLSDKAFLAGRSNETEGGPKGIDIDLTGAFLAVTCEEQPLAFFGIRTLFSTSLH